MICRVYLSQNLEVMFGRKSDFSLALVRAQPTAFTFLQKVAYALIGFGLTVFGLAWLGAGFANASVLLWLIFGSVVVGSMVLVYDLYAGKPQGIKNDGVFFKSISARGIAAWLVGVALTSFYIMLYWYPEYMTNIIGVFEPLSQLLQHAPADQWFVYGTIYTFSVLILGVKFIAKYRHNRYQVLRTISVMLFQLLFSYLIPAFLKMMHEPTFYFSYFWPLKSEYLFPPNFQYLSSQKGGLPVFMMFWTVMMSFVAVPTLTYFFGKRWYCSWVCGCGGLAETTGDSFRQLSDKSLSAWRFERYSIHIVLLLVVGLTGVLWLNSAFQGKFLGDFSQGYSQFYGFLVSSTFAGVIGTGFYPIFGNRVWCRFGCPQAAILGIFQKYFSRFRIEVNGGQCISCGNCSTYCEMGIDVRGYAQRGQAVVRASCVGCGVCSAVCPRGVLRLESSPTDFSQRTTELKALHIGKDGINLH
jgi:ferredoxin-type protein NapH